MRTTALSADCDSLVYMEDLGIGAREILVYARAVLSRREVSKLLAGLERVVLCMPLDEACRRDGPCGREPERP